MNTLHGISLDDFARSFGTTIAELPDIREADFTYRSLTQPERDAVILGILERLASDTTKVGAHRHAVWEKGWTENLEKFAAKGFALEELVPRFVRPDQIVRFNREFIRPTNPKFEYDYFSVFRRWLYRHYLADSKAVYEFGCGSGYNLVALADLFPNIDLVGLDWAESAVNLVNLIGQKHGIRLSGRRFDFFAPDPTLKLPTGSIAMTMCALEQTGERFEEFLQMLLKQSPALVINMEPLLELYDPANLLDYLAIRYHTQRGYLTGYLTRLRQLATEGRIEILKTQRLQFGSLCNEGYSYVVWRPHGSRT